MNVCRIHAFLLSCLLLIVRAADGVQLSLCSVCSEGEEGEGREEMPEYEGGQSITPQARKGQLQKKMWW